MNTYVCEVIIDGVECTISFDAPSLRRAENIARKGGWSILAVWEEALDTEAMLEKELLSPRIH